MPLFLIAVIFGLYLTRSGAGGAKAEGLLVVLLLLAIPFLVLGCIVESCSCLMTKLGIAGNEVETSPPVVGVQPPAFGTYQMYLPSETKPATQAADDAAWKNAQQLVKDGLRREEEAAAARRLEAENVWFRKKAEVEQMMRRAETEHIAARKRADELWKEEMKKYNPPTTRNESVKAQPSKARVK